MDLSCVPGSSRTKRLFQALEDKTPPASFQGSYYSKKDQDRLCELDLPKYESTKGTNSEEKKKALKGSHTTEATASTTSVPKHVIPIEAFTLPLILTEYCKQTTGLLHTKMTFQPEDQRSMNFENIEPKEIAPPIKSQPGQGISSDCNSFDKVQTKSTLSESDVGPFFVEKSKAHGIYNVQAKSTLTESDVDPFFVEKSKAHGIDNVQTKSTLTESDVDPFFVEKSKAHGIDNVQAKSTLTESDVDPFFVEKSKAHGIDNVQGKSTLTESDIDPFFVEKSKAHGIDNVQAKSIVNESDVDTSLVKQLKAHGISIVSWQNIDNALTDLGSPVVLELGETNIAPLPTTSIQSQIFVCENLEFPSDSHNDSDNSNSYAQNTDQKSSITVQTVKIGHSKQFPCPFCHKFTTVLPRHLCMVHKNEPEVLPLFSTNRSKRLHTLNELRQRGIFRHNTAVEESGKGVLITKRLPKYEEDPKKFLPCDLCTAYVSVKNVARHQLKCKKKPTSSTGRNCNAKMRGLLLKGHISQENENFRKLLLGMKGDDITNVVMNDPLIKDFGIHLSTVKGPKWKFIKDKLRELGRFMMCAKILDSNVNTLSDVLLPQKYNLIVEATKKISGYDSAMLTFKVPTLAIKVGQSLRKCLVLLKKMYLSDNDLAGQVSTLDRLQSIFSLAWLEDIEAIARRNLDEIKWNKPQRVPSSQDVKLLNDHLKQLSVQYVKELCENPSAQSFRLLTEVALARTITFNRKRPGEVQEMKKELYEDSLKNKALSRQTMEGISDSDLSFARSLLRMKTRGKRDTGVSVMFTADMQQIMNELLKRRQDCGIPSENPYLFPCGTTSNGLFRATDLLRKFVSECQISSENAWRLTSTGLRKHVATVSQLLNLSNNELDCLAKYLGHDITVHRKYYRLTDESVELGKISKLLHLMSEGKLSELKGRSLNELEFNGDEEEFEEEDTSIGGIETITPQEQCSAQNDNDLPENVPEQLLEKSKNMQSDKSDIDSATSEDDDINYEPSPKRKRKTRAKKNESSARKRRNFTKRRPWSDVETSSIQTHFLKYVQGEKGPSKVECEDFINSSGHVLQRRSYRDIVYHVHNLRKKFLR